MTATKKNNLTPLTRTQDDIVHRWKLRATAHEDDKRRGVPPAVQEQRLGPLANLIDREHAEQLLSDDTKAEHLPKYPEQAPSREGVLYGLVTGEPTNRFTPHTNLHTLVSRARDLRIELDMLAEYAWALGRDDVSEAIVNPREHHEVGLVALMSVVRFCEAFNLTLPKEGPDGELARDLAEAQDALAAERDAISAAGDDQ